MSNAVLTLPCEQFTQWGTASETDHVVGEGEHWAIVGLPSTTQSALLAYCKATSGSLAEISLARQAELIEAERKRASVGMADQLVESSAVREMLSGSNATGEAGLDALIEGLALQPLLDKPFDALDRRNAPTIDRDGTGGKTCVIAHRQFARRIGHRQPQPRHHRD